MKKNLKGGYLDKEINITIPIKEAIINVEKEDFDNFGKSIEINTDNRIEHEMFLRIMENELLREAPIELQNNKITQEEIRKKVEEIYNIKEKGQKILIKEKEDGYEYNQSLEYLKNSRFDSVKWIYPVVLDQKVIYALRCENDDETSGEVPYGDKLENQTQQLKEMNSLYKKRKNGEINLVSFYSGVNKQELSYLEPPDTFWDKDMPKAKKVRLSDYSELYRYINIANKTINRIGKGPLVINLEKDILTLVGGETIYIVGFLFIPIFKEVDIAIKEALENKVDGRLDPKKSYLLLFDNAKDTNIVSDEEYLTMLKRLIPTSEEVTESIIKHNKNIDIYEYDKKLKEWGYNIRNITNNSWNKIKDILVKSSSLINTEPVNNTIDYIIDGNELVRDSEYYSKLMKSIYNQDLNYDYKNSKLQRVHVLNETDDNGSFYYTYSYSKIKKNPDVKRLQKLKKELKVPNEIPELKNTRDEFNKLNKIPLKVFHLSKKVNSIKNLLENIDETIKQHNIRKNEYDNYLKQEAEFIFSYYVEKIISKLDKTKINEALLGKIMHDKEQNSHIIIPEEIPVSLTSVIKQINTIDKYSEKKQLLYTIIQLDGIIVDDYIYSIFYGKPLICGHWYYLLMIDNASTETQRNKWTTLLLSIYGDDGRSDKSEESCIKCGAFLDRTSLVEPFYSNTWGMPVQVDDKFFYRHSLELNQFDALDDNIKKYNSPEFKYILNKRKIDNNDFNNALLASKVILGIMSKIDIDIPTRNYIELVIQCVKDSRKIPVFEKYYLEKIESIAIKRKKEKIENEELKNKIEISYIKYFMVRYGTLILAHLLWYIRTTFPVYFPGKNSITSCSFFGFENDNGFDYFTCVVLEMKILSINIQIKNKTINENIPKNKIVENFRYWLNSFEENYKNALLRKHNYESTLQILKIRTGNNRLDRENPIDWADELVVGKIKNIKEISSYNDVIFEIRKRVFKIRNFLNNFINTQLIPDSKKVEVSCCEDITDKNYIDYFENDILELSDENKLLQTKYELFNNRLIPTTFKILSNSTTTFINFPFNILDVPETFIKSAFITYCHDGQSIGKYHFFENKNIEISRCIKCGWLLNTLQENTFTRENFVNLMENVDKQNLEDYTNLRFKRKKLNVIYLKRNSHIDKINEDIEKLATKISRLIKTKENEKELFNKVKNFLQNIDNFKKFISESDNSTDKEKIELVNARNTFSIQKMREYINEFFRKNVSRIKSGYKIKKNIDISWIPKRYEEKWNRIIIDKNTWLETFLTKQNETLFQKFKFNFTIENIDTIIGRPSVYSSSYKRSISSSIFDLSDTINVLKHYMIKEMLSFLDMAGSGQPILAEFYLKLFDEIEKDRKIINISTKEITHWTDKIQEENIIIREKYFDVLREEETIFNTPYRKFTDDIYNDPIYNQKLTTSQDIEEEQELEERTELEEDLKYEAMGELGEDASEQVIEDFVRESMEEDVIEKEILDELYDNDIKGEDIIDSDYEYGDEPEIEPEIEENDIE